jgi:transposase
MGKPYSTDLRERFVGLLASGMSASAAGVRMCVTVSTAIRWAATWRSEGRAKALPMGGDRRSAPLEQHAALILDWVKEKPDLFLREIVGKLAERKVETSQRAVARLLARHGITRKKRPSSRQNRTGRMSRRPVPNGAKV